MEKLNTLNSGFKISLLMRSSDYRSLNEVQKAKESWFKLSLKPSPCKGI
jgi:hypothetical protein